MIASLVATLDGHMVECQHSIAKLAKLPGVEIGAIAPNKRRVPVVIEATDPSFLEEITRRLQECHGVAFVDVVFVHWEKTGAEN